jgi:hypothetical protein
VSDHGDLLELLLSAKLVAALEQHVREVAAQAVREELARQPQRQWLPVEQAAKRYGCTPEALRMRVKRGTVEARRQGRRLYVRAVPGQEGDEVLW